MRSLFASSALLSGLWLLTACGGTPLSQAPCGEIDPAAEPVVQIGHPSRMRATVFSPDGKQFLTMAYGSHVGRREEIILWDAESGDKLRAFPADTHRLTPSFCLDGRAVVIGGNVWDLQTGKRRHAVLDDDESPTDVNLSVDGRRMIVGTRGGVVRLVDLESGRIESREVTARLFNAAERTGSADATSGNNWLIESVGIAPDGTPLALLADNSVHDLVVWNVAKGEKQVEIDLNHYIDSVRFSPYARYVITRHWEDTGSSVETTVVYNASTGQGTRTVA